MWCGDGKGAFPGREYFLALQPVDRSKFTASFIKRTNEWEWHNVDRYRDEGDGICAFKIHGHRLVGFRDGRDVLITHGYAKKTEKMPKRELARAVALRSLYTELKASPCQKDKGDAEEN